MQLSVRKQSHNTLYVCVCVSATSRRISNEVGQAEKPEIFIKTTLCKQATGLCYSCSDKSHGAGTRTNKPQEVTEVSEEARRGCDN